MAAFAGQEADDCTFSMEFANYLDPNQYQYDEVPSTEVQSTGIFHEMMNMPPPDVQISRETPQAADGNFQQNAQTGKTSRHKILTPSDVDNVQHESIRPRTRKQTDWGVNVFKGNNYSCFNRLLSGLTKSSHFLS